MTMNPHQRKLVAYLQREMYSKAHSAVEEHRQYKLATILSEADPHPRVEKDEKGEPVVPSQEDYANYFQNMAATHIQDQVKRCEAQWAAAKSDTGKIAKATKQSIANELAAANEVLKSKTGPDASSIQATIFGSQD